MEAAVKHFRFINSKTGYVIFHYTIKEDLAEAELKVELEKIKAEVASQNKVFLSTIYWEEEKD
jgi:hypothetical protein